MTRVVAGLRRLSAEMDRLDDVSARLYGLNRTDMRALDIIGQAGAVAPTVLADLLGFTTGGITTVLDRLENSGYIERRPDPSDRRRLVVQVTDTTRATDAATFGKLVAATHTLLDGYSDDDLGVIGDFLDKTAELTGRYAAELSAGHPNATRARRPPNRRSP